MARNGQRTLPRLLEDLCGQDYPHNQIEVLLVDSMSTDSTRAIMEDFAAQHPDFKDIRVLVNPNRTLPCGCNVALKNYTGDAIVRVDAHASIPPEFISKNVRVLESGEMVCGGQRPNIIDEYSPWKRILLTAEQSMFGSSIASYRHSNQCRYVSSIFHGMYRREVYDKVGPYDERLARTEDNDMSFRIREAGFRICYDPEIVSYQHTRNSLQTMLRQKYLNGYWIGKTMGINPKCFSTFHFVPFAFVLGILFTTCLALLGHPFLSALMWTAYGVVCLLFSVLEIRKQSFHWTSLLLPFVFLILHVCYGWGTLVGLAELPFWLHKMHRSRQ